MVEKDSENFYSKYLRISLPFLVLIFLSFSVFALTTQDANYSGGVYNGGFELGLVDSNIPASSASTYDLNIGWWFTQNTGTEYANIVNSEFYSGTKSAYVNVSSVGAGTYAFLDITPNNASTTSSNLLYQNISVKPNTKYKVSAWIKTNEDCNVKIRLYEKIVGNQFGNNKDSGYVYANSDWSYISNTLTSAGTTNFFRIVIGVLGASDMVDGCEFYVDDVRLEEVGSVNLSGQSQGRPSIVVTGVSDNAIDQADTNNSTSRGIGNLTRLGTGQIFTPTQNRFSGVGFTKVAGIGTFAGDLNLVLYDTNGTHPINLLTSKLITNAEWNAITNDVRTNFYLPYILDANGTNRYYVGLISTTQSDTNTASIRATTGNTYSGGNIVDFNNGAFIPSTTTDLTFITLFEKQSSAFDLNVCSSGDSVCESKTYDISDLNDGETYTISPSDAPLFYSGDNNVYFMMHSDSDYNNKTPSMMAKLTYTFDKPTTTLSKAKGTVDNTEIITLTCTNGTTGNCNQTYYSFNGITYYTYNTPFVLNNGTYNIRYYSTADNNNTETINTSSFTVLIQGSTATCSIAGLFPLLLIAFGITALGGLFFTKQFLDTGDMKYMINFILMLIIGVLIIITIAPILC